MISDILVHLPVEPSRVGRDYAVSVATLLDAHLTAVVFIEEFPAWAAVDGSVPALIEEWSAEQQKKASAAAQAFENSARASGIRYDCHVLSSKVATNVADLFGRLARSYDVSVIVQPGKYNENSNDLVIETALFDSGRPVLIVPFIQTGGIKLDHAMVCWDGGRNAARAIGDAMPFLERARKVEVIAIETKELPQELRASRICEHLARHKVNAELKTISAGDIEAANIILNEASDTGADLIVMGGYGHTRFRELVLGGVTRSMLESMTAPVLMAH